MCCVHVHQCVCVCVLCTLRYTLLGGGAEEESRERNLSINMAFVLTVVYRHDTWVVVD